MADDVVARLVAVMEADLKNFSKGMEQAQRIADQRFGVIEKRMKQTEKSFDASFKSIASLARGLLPALSVAGVISFAQGLLKTADALGDTAQQLGLTTQQLQGLQSAARDTGANTEKVTAALGTFTDRLGDARKGNGELAKTMRDLNIPMGTTMQVLLDVADATQKASSQSEKMAIATAAFGRAGQQLVPMLDQGAAGLKRMLEEAQKKGQIWDPETVKRLGDLNDAFERLKVTLTGAFANPLAATIESAKDLIDFLNKPEVKAFFNWRTGALTFGTSRLEAENLPLLAKESFQPALGGNAPRTAVPLPETEIAAAAKRAAEERKRAIEAAIKAEKDGLEEIHGIIARFEASEEKERQERLKKATEDELEGWKEMQDKIAEARALVANEKFDKSVEAVNSLREAFDITGAAGVRAFDNIGDAFEQMLQQISAKVFQMGVMTPILDALFGKKGEAPGGLLGGAIGKAFSGSGGGFFSKLFGFAEGGFPPVGRASIVGERGPELFVPRVPGVILPAGMTMGEPARVVVSVLPSGEFDVRVAQTSHRVAVSVVGQYDRALPSRVNQIASDPLRR